MKNMERTVLSVYGSPRGHGFSSNLHDILLGPLRDSGCPVISLQAFGMKISPCDGCGYCRLNPRCVHDDAMTGVYGMISACSLLVISSPVYFSGLPAPLKMIIDRCQVLWENPAGIFPKKGLFISVAGSDYRTVFDGSTLTVRHFFNTIKASCDEKDFLFLKGSDSMNMPPAHLQERARGIGEKYARLLLERGSDPGETAVHETGV
jgi:multimeric flavodoxin WrbA